MGEKGKKGRKECFDLVITSKTYHINIANVSLSTFSTGFKNLLISQCISEAPIFHLRDPTSSPRGEITFVGYTNIG